MLAELGRQRLDALPLAVGEHGWPAIWIRTTPNRSTVPWSPRLVHAPRVVTGDPHVTRYGGAVIVRWRATRPGRWFDGIVHPDVPREWIRRT